jgi:hypothetical protein
MEKEQLVNTIKEWIEIDTKIIEMNKLTREYRKRKTELTSSLINVMKSNDLDEFDLKDKKIMYHTTKSKSGLTKKHLIKSLGELFKDDTEKVSEITDYILNSREIKVKENLRRKDIK